jgi:8-oxo-dGTP diphosphatase
MPGRPQIGIGVLITKDDQVLLVKRRDVQGGAAWAPPAGRPEYGKSLEESVIRAAQEQIGAIIADITFLAITNDVFDAQKKHAITIWMAARFVSSEPGMPAARAISATGWFSWDALPEPLFSPFEHLLTGRCYPALWDFSGGAKLP